MTVAEKLAQIKTLLTGITGFSDKVAYHSFPVGAAPDLPFIVYLEKGSENFGADNIAFYGAVRIDIEFYSKTRDTASEALIEAALTGADIYFERYIDYLEDEKCFETLYEIEV